MPYVTVMTYAGGLAVVFASTVQVSGVTPLFEHVIDPLAGVGAIVQVDAVVRSSSVPPEVPWAMKLCITVLVAFGLQVSAVEPMEQAVVAPDVPMHT